MRLEAFTPSRVDQDFSTGWANDKGRRYSFICSNKDGEIARLWQLVDGQWIIDTSPPPFTLAALIRERLGIEKPVHAGWVAPPAC